MLKDHYRARLRKHLVAELLAGAGIAVGVALVFGVLVASGSITGTTAALIRAVNGSATLQLAARSSGGFSEQLANRAGELPGVKNAADVLREDATIVGPRGRQSIQMVGVTANIVALGGSATQNLGAGAELLKGGIGLPSRLAGVIGAQARQDVTLLTDGETRHVLVRAILNSGTIGLVAESPIVVGLLPTIQTLANEPGRVTQLLIEPERGKEALVLAELRRLAAGRVEVEPASHELGVLNQTAKPLSQSTALFAAISAMVGFLLAINAMLLTLPDRRRFVLGLFRDGFDLTQIIVLMLFQALALGLLASIAGIAFGDILAHTLFHQTPVYLAAAFPITIHQSIQLYVVLLAVAGGLLASVLASLPPILELRKDRQPSSARRLSPTARNGAQTLGLIGVALVVIVTVLVLVEPALTILGGVLLALAVPCFIPMLFQIVTVAVKRWSRYHSRRSMLTLATVELRAAATRSIALIGVTALAIYGSVAIQGTRHDLTRGLDQATIEYLDTADVWVAPNNNFLTIDGFRAGHLISAIRQAPGVAEVRTYQGSLLDIGTRRMWIRARPANDHPLLQASQLQEGNLTLATKQLQHGGWAAVSGGFASERHLHIGSPFVLPTPAGAAQFRVAAITTNIGWSPGAITINTSDFQRYWRASEPTALEVNLRPGVSQAAGRLAVEHAIGYQPALRVETTDERTAIFEATASEGLRSLGQISTLLLVSAALAVAAVLSAAIWQRRGRLASLKADGFADFQLWRALMLESLMAVAIGCIDGLVLGFYGHALASRWLALTTGFPAPFSLGNVQVLFSLVLVILITVLTVAVPGFSAARVPPRVSFQE
ncbi:MAG TPA: FtsX-like permease family protein [Solirubrobacteraceae bacterium]